MVDNFAFTEGSGRTGAADDILGVLYPRTKVTWGADGTANDADIASGKALPVQLRDSDGTDVAISGKLGIITEVAPATDTASSGLNGRLQRIAQRLTSLIALLPASLGANGGLKVEGIAGGTAVPVSAASLPLPSGAASEATLSALNTKTNTEITADYDTGAGTQTMKLAGIALPGAGGAVPGGTSTAPVRTDPTGTTTQPVSGTVTANLAAGTNNIGDVDVLTVNGVAPAFGSGVRGATVQRVTVATDDVVPASQSGTWTVQPGNTANTTPWLTSDQARTSGGATPYKLVSAATTNATSVKASAGQVYMITASNVNAAARYLKLYNLTVAPTVGTSVPVFTFVIPGNTAGAGTNIPVPSCGLEFTTGIALALTTEATDAGATAVAASEIVINLAYK